MFSRMVEQTQMSVWFCIPSARPPEQVEPVLAQWRERGYKIALWRDDFVLEGKPIPFEDTADMVYFGQYLGYAESVNFLASKIMQVEPSCDWIVTGGDDTLPDPNHTADQIAAQCSEKFYTAIECACPPNRPAWSEIPIPSPCGSGKDAPSWKRWSTFGVMQPTGDRFAGGSIDRIAGSAWMGREWCLRINQGKGPLWPEYFHMFEDEELQNVATKLGVFWQRPDLIHKHMHFQRESDAIDSPAVAKPVPPHLVYANSKENWDKMKAIFDWRKANGFPGHEPL